MLNEKINELIKEAMKSKDHLRVETLRLIKAAFLNYQTAKNSKPLDNSAEIQILKKMVSQRKDSIDQYKLAGRQDLIDHESAELSILSEFLPAEVDKGELESALVSIYESGEIECDKRNMGILIRSLKAKYPSADGKLISEVVKSSFN